MKNPYKKLPNRAFWRQAVAARHPLDIASLWAPKHELLPTDAVATAGSCFAQHIGRSLVQRGYNWIDAEPAPKAFDSATRREYNYGVFSFRTGNIYTAAAFRQWVEWALEIGSPPGEIWKNRGRYYDPFRPNIEPDGFSSKKELTDSRRSVLHAVRTVVTEADVIVFTLGLTEAWVNRDHGHVYAMCPGTLAGRFDPESHMFRNYVFAEVERDLQSSLSTMKSVNPKLRFILTVSPVPLTATASDAHVLSATTYSKSVLRAVAGQMCLERPDVDYFPSYEMITGAPFRSMFYEPNLRTVSKAGVEFVMDSFFSCMENTFGSTAAKNNRRGAKSRKTAEQRMAEEAVCEEEMLGAFGDTAK